MSNRRQRRRPQPLREGVTFGQLRAAIAATARGRPASPQNATVAGHML